MAATTPAAWEVQKAVFQLFSQNTDLQALNVGVYDAIPEFSGYPYILIGFLTENPWNTYDKTGKDITLTLHIYSLYDGNKEIYEIKQVIEDLLNRKDRNDISLGAGHDLIGCLEEYSDIIEENDFGDNQRMKHMVLRYRFWTQEK